MEQMIREQAYRQVVGVLPPRLRQEAFSLPLQDQCRAEELRLRVGQPMSAVFPEGERPLGGEPVRAGELEQLVEIASRASVHAVLDQLRRGYLTVEGGHRIGLCGTAVLREGEIHSLRQLSSAAIRVARQVRNASDPVLGRLCPGGKLVSTLILAPPGLSPPGVGRRWLPTAARILDGRAWGSGSPLQRLSSAGCRLQN